MASPPQLLPWGRLRLTSKPSNELQESDHISLSRSQHRIGREASRCDIIIRKTFISGLHCIVTRQGKDNKGNPIVFLEDLSRHGTYVDRQLVGRRNKVALRPGMTVHLTDPASTVVVQLAYMFETNPSGLTKSNELLHEQLSADDQSVSSRLRKRTRSEPESEPTQPTQPTQPIPSTTAARPTKQSRRTSTGSSDKQPASQHGTTGSTSTEQAPPAPVSSVKGAAKKRRREVAATGDDTNRDDKVKLLKLQNEFDAMQEISSTRISMSDARTKATREELEKVRKQLQECEQQNRDLQEQLKEQKRLVEEAQTKAKRLQRELDSKIDECDSLAADLVEATAVSRDNNQAQATAVKARRERTTESYEAQLKARDAKISRLEEQLHDTQNELEACLKKAAASVRTPSPLNALKQNAKMYQAMRNFFDSRKREQEEERERVAKMCRMIQESLNPQSLAGPASSQELDSQESDTVKAARRTSQGSTGSSLHTEPSPLDDVSRSQDTQSQSQSSQSQDAKIGEGIPLRPTRTFHRGGLRGSTAPSGNAGRMPRTTASKNENKDGNKDESKSDKQDEKADDEKKDESPAP